MFTSNNLVNPQVLSSLSKAIKILGADSVQKASSGHPGMVLGMSDVMTCMAANFLRFNPKDPKWFNRDRLVLSNGHGSMLLYAFYYLTGYKNFSLEDLKNFRQLHSKTPGHPEYGSYEAIEATTGPLGQGLATAIGMAIAAKKYQQYASHELVDYKIYCIVGDGCLMEGISYEAMSLAGHLGLNNIIVLFDDNQITIDGATSLSVSEDHLAKCQALGWGTEQVDGHDFNAINTALSKAQDSQKPYFIACRTIIAKDTNKKLGSAEAHGAPLGEDEIIFLKNKLGFSYEPFSIPDELLHLWKQIGQKHINNYNTWQEKYNKLPENTKNYLVEGWNVDKIKLDTITLELDKSPKAEPTRVSSGYFLASLLKNSSDNKIILGSADLSASNNLYNKYCKAITASDFSGNFIHYGIRENAMGAIMNGLSLSGFKPISGTFLVFSDYMRPAIRIAAISKLPVIYVMTHDSILVGEDGPTHQPVEHLASFRAMPNLLLLRPADEIETMECWQIALKQRNRPTMIVLTRQNVKQLRSSSNSNWSEHGAYDIAIANNYQNVPSVQQEIYSTYDISIFASGSELSLAQAVADKLRLIKPNLKIRLISIPSFELFFAQEENYRNILLNNSKIKVAIEAATSFGWHQIIGSKGLFFGVTEFGLSAPGSKLCEYFNLTPEKITKEIQNYII